MSELPLISIKSWVLDERRDGNMEKSDVWGQLDAAAFSAAVE